METRIDRLGSVREDKLRQLKQLIADYDNIVFLGGAGVSTESVTLPAGAVSTALHRGANPAVAAAGKKR